MSATFKNAKKKLSQSELRKIMKDHKSKPKDVKKIDSPLAKYNEQGQLLCVLCQSVVRSEAVWTVHINAKLHKQNVEMAKKLKERTNNFTKPLKRPLTPPLAETPDKKIKGILKNGTSSMAINTNSTLNTTRNNTSNESTNTLPNDFFDSKSKKDSAASKKENGDPQIESLQEAEDALPEGFFDDPKLDAKARKQEYKDPVEEEWERFLKVIKNADNESNAIMAEDQEESTTERQIDEIDEQMKKLSRVLDLEKKKEEIVASSCEPKQSFIGEDNEDENLDEFDEFLDWRDKKSFQ